MKITNITYPYQTPAQKARSSSGTSGGTSFGAQLDIAARRNTDQLEISAPGAVWQDGGIHMLSPYCQLMDSYDAWKAQQPSQDLPDSWGPTEENLAYLKEHYSGLGRIKMESEFRAVLKSIYDDDNKAVLTMSTTSRSCAKWSDRYFYTEDASRNGLDIVSSYQTYSSKK